MANVLVIEDDTTLNSAYKLILEKEGHTVVTAFNGKEGFTALEKFRPDIILLDLLMPVMDGLHFLREFKKTDKDTKVVILTNLDQDKQVDEAIDLGAYKYIVKAHSAPQELAALVNHLIKRNIEKED